MQTVQTVILAFLLSAPLWTPIAFGAFALGRKQFGLVFLFLLIAAEAGSLVVYWIAALILGIRTAQLGGP